MKKVLAMLLVLTMTLSMAFPASAMTFGSWDLGAARKSIDSAVKDILSEQEYEITYDFNGGFVWNFHSSPSFASELSCTDSGSHTVIDTVPLRPMYKFAGWECNGEILSAGDILNLSGNVTLTAVWQKG